MKHISLRQHAYVNGVLRSPSEGIVKLEDEEAQRLFDAELADDVSADFPDEDGPASKVTVKPSDLKAA
ncbi:hypothetical protein [uncultured Sphingomonas sp.]|uniref:hypothetical protein n=1 Tax=uncultured Sphingomonas sp. TaxID=158754 RepID=UPI002602D1E9|nr:hypothetical protein [uncultured Sphingomonas sp.]